jgi:hypothetical protein
MSLLNPEWVDFDKHTRALKLAGWYAEVSDTIDNEIQANCIERGVTIPLDIDGYIDSPVLRSLSVDYAVFSLLTGNWGISDNDSQLYRDKASYHWSQYDKKLKSLCPTLV